MLVYFRQNHFFDWSHVQNGELIEPSRKGNVILRTPWIRRLAAATSLPRGLFDDVAKPVGASFDIEAR